jgi:predicted 3-demethylubiquinone-9 3-methyltransferase (glyoxalase superfamily)
MAVIFDEEEEPDIKEQQYATVFNLLVNCDDENQQEALFNKLQGEGYKCQPQSL